MGFACCSRGFELEDEEEWRARALWRIVDVPMRYNERSKNLVSIMFKR